jgi:hypothetical protein
MTTQEKQQLLYLLKIFFADHDINARDFLSKDMVGKFLKGKLISLNRWKNLPRGKSFRV